MHRSLLCSGIALALILGFSACEQHEWDSTKKLHQPHHGHGHSGDEDPHHGGKNGENGKEEVHQEDGKHEKPATEEAATPRSLGTE